MPSLTECIDKLKEEIQGITPNKPMSQSYIDMSDSFLLHSDADEAKQFVQLLKNNHTTLNAQTLNNPYSASALQCAWNIADILSIIVRYTPCEWSAGCFRGLMASGPNKELNITNLVNSIIYMGEASTPYIVDEVTYQINQIFLSFIKRAQLTENGRSIFAMLQKLSHNFGENICLDEEIIATARARLVAYEQHQLQQLSLQKQIHGVINNSMQKTESDDDNEEGLIFYDAQTHVKQDDIDEIKEKAMTLTLDFSTKALLSLHDNRSEFDEEEYNDAKELFFEISDTLLDANVTLDSINRISNDNAVECFLAQHQSRTWIQYFEDIWNYFKQKIEELLAWYGFEPAPSLS